MFNIWPHTLHYNHTTLGHLHRLHCLATGVSLMGVCCGCDGQNESLSWRGARRANLDSERKLMRGRGATMEWPSAGDSVMMWIIIHVAAHTVRRCRRSHIYPICHPLKMCLISTPWRRRRITTTTAPSSPLRSCLLSVMWAARGGV